VNKIKSIDVLNLMTNKISFSFHYCFISIEIIVTCIGLKPTKWCTIVCLQQLSSWWIKEVVIFKFVPRECCSHIIDVINVIFLHEFRL